MIKKANKKQLEEIIQVIIRSYRETFQTAFQNISDADLDFPREEIVDVFNKMDFYVYMKNKKIIGTSALGKISKDQGLVRAVYILPEYQRQGIGQCLMNNIENVAKAQGLKSLLLYTPEEAYWAINFYKKLGYQITKKEKEDWGVLVYLEKILV